MISKSLKTLLTTEVRALVHKSFDELLSEQDMQQLDQLLSSHPELRRWYAEVAQLHADLITHSQAYEACKQLQEEYPTPESKQALSEPKSWRSRQWFGVNGWKEQGKISPFVAAASLLIIGLGLGCGVGIFASTAMYIRPAFIALPWDWHVDNEVVAKIEATKNVQWQSSESPETLPTLGVRPGQQIRIERGHILLAFRSGARLTLQGPAVFEVRSGSDGKLYDGKIFASAPSWISSFQVETPDGQVQFGPGLYAIEANGDGSKQSNYALHAIEGVAADVPSAHFLSNHGEQLQINGGQSLRINERGVAEVVALQYAESPPNWSPTQEPMPFEGEVIPLSNLFDDSKTESLTNAVQSDSYRAAGEIVDLGVVAVHDGGLDADVSLAEDGVRFNLGNVGGGGPKVRGLPSNDTYRSVASIPIRTTGIDFGPDEAFTKVEDGIGMSPNELLTFDVDEIRSAGVLGNVAMRFVSDRAGINDRAEYPLRNKRLASACFVVIVSNEQGVISGYLNGRQVDVLKRGGTYVFDASGEELTALRANGEFVAFDVPVPADARFLTLATTMFDDEHNDHAVFSGARLELVTEASDVEKVARVD